MPRGDSSAQGRGPGAPRSPCSMSSEKIPCRLLGEGLQEGSEMLKKKPKTTQKPLFLPEKSHLEKVEKYIAGRQVFF